MSHTRREILKLAGQAAAAGMLAPLVPAGGASAPTEGVVVGDPVAAKVGEKVLRDGGNAIDAAIAAAFAATICSPGKCGMGGYGGHAMIGLAGGRTIAAIDFNSTAPAAARPDMFPVDDKGRVVGGVNTTGWLAAAVPGTLAGLELALSRYGTRSLRDVLGPAIQMCEEGVYVARVKGLDDAAKSDAVREGGRDNPVAPEKQRNRALARLLKTLAERNSAESFYRGDIADRIAAAFQRNGGLVTREDLAAYRAREFEPLALEWNGFIVQTVPLPATGLLVLEALGVLKALDWSGLDAPQRLHAGVEALRVAWADRLRTFGDPDIVDVPVNELLSARHVDELAERVKAAVAGGRPVAQEVDPSRAGGTVNISAADRAGNAVALTLTHGGGYGAKVAVEEFGLILGHGMSRFDPRPGRPNSPGPRKRPITNMCPTIVTRGGVPVLAVGAAGGTRIPNGVFEVLLNFVGRGTSMEEAMAAPRVHTDGTLALALEKSHSAAHEVLFKKIGYKVTRAASANVSAVAYDPARRLVHGAQRGGPY